MSNARGPVIRNVSFVETTVTVEAYLGHVECEDVPLSEVEEPTLLGSPNTNVLKYGRSIGLHPEPQDASAQTVDTPHYNDAPSCGAAVVTGEHVPDWLVSWDLADVESPSESELDEGKVPPGNIYLERWGTSLREALGEGIFVSVMPK